MTKLLVINSSPMGEKSISRKMVQFFVDEYKTNNLDVDVIEHDTIEMNLPHLDGETISAFFNPQEGVDKTGQLAKSNEILKDVSDADAIVIGLPMHNFGIPSNLKAYIDRLCRIGVTVKFTEAGPQGLLKDKPVYVVCARGSDFTGDLKPYDFALPYIAHIFSFIGLKSVQVFGVEGVNLGEGAAEKAMELTSSQIKEALAA